LGGRLGIRLGDWKAGLSMTRDHFNVGSLELAPGEVVDLQQLTRRRIGADLSCVWNEFSFEAEFIDVSYDDDLPQISEDKRFYYATLGYRVSERWLLYGSYWVTREHSTERIEPEPVGILKQRVIVPNAGFSYQIRDSILIKAQYAPVDIEARFAPLDLAEDIEFDHLSASLSVMF
jgi:hypothetical protein